MPRYAPQSLPMGGSRPQGSSADDMEQQQAPESTVHTAVSLGQHIRRERGMEGVRGYAVALREYLPTPEYQELCRTLGVPADLPAAVHRPPQPPQQPVQEAPPPAQNNNGNMQMMQMLMQLMAMQNGGMGGGMGGMGGGGFNPLAQLGGMQGGQNGMNPLMLAQLLNGMQQK